MDQHSLMWDNATRDLTAETAESALVHTLTALSGVQGFTHLAASHAEYGHRVALSADSVRSAAEDFGADPAAVQDALDRSFGHVLAARTAAAPPPFQSPAAQAGEQPSQGLADDGLVPSVQAATSKPRTMPTGGVPPVPPMMPMSSAAPPPTGEATSAPGKTAARKQPCASESCDRDLPSVSYECGNCGQVDAHHRDCCPQLGGDRAPAPRTVVSRRAVIRADIVAYNPHLPKATVDRLTAQAMRHLADDALAYNNWNSPDDGPMTKDLKGAQFPKPEAPAAGGGEGLSGSHAPAEVPAASSAAAPALEDVLRLAALRR